MLFTMKTLFLHNPIVFAPSAGTNYDITADDESTAQIAALSRFLYDEHNVGLLREAEHPYSPNVHLYGTAVLL